MIRGLDGLRALAVLLVIAVHVAATTRLPWGVLGPFDHVVHSGQLGVDLFFALSGFLITTLILREERANVLAGRRLTFSLSNFYIRRALRILPPFYLVMALLIPASGAFALLSTARPAREIAAEAPGALVSILTFWWNYYGVYVHPVDVGQAFGITWSLCVEEHFYLLWPATLLLVKNPRHRVTLAAAVCFGALGLRHAAVHFGVAPSSLGAPTHYRVDAIMWGALAALCRHEGWLPPARRRRFALGVVAGLVGVLLWHADLLVSPNGTVLGAVYGRTAASILFTLLVLETAESPRSIPTFALELPPLAWMGKVSYGMYLLHNPAIDLARVAMFRGPVQATPWHFLVTLGLAVAITTAAASMMFLLWERPFQRLRARFRQESQPAAAASSRSRLPGLER